MTRVLRLASARIVVLHDGEPQLIIPVPALATAALLLVAVMVLFGS